jgi:ankyrin repeat protein
MAFEVLINELRSCDKMSPYFVDILINDPTQINHQDKVGDTILHVTAKFSTQLSKLLLIGYDYNGSIIKADPNIQNNYNMTPFHYAVNSDICWDEHGSILPEWFDADVTIREYKNKTCLMDIVQLVRINVHQKIISILEKIKDPTFINLKDDNGYSVLSYACYNNKDYVLVKFLLQLGATIDQKSIKFSISQFYYTSTTILRAFLDHGLDDSLITEKMYNFEYITPGARELIDEYRAISLIKGAD